MNILIFDNCVTGHHLEYLHHLYVEAIKRTGDSFFFLLPLQFEDMKGQFDWTKSDNIQIIYLTDKEQRLCAESNLLKSAWHKSVIVRNAVRAHSIDKVWLIMLMHLMPFLPWMLPNHVKISGIIYRVYLYEKGLRSKLRMNLERIRYRMMVASRCMEKIFVLNDEWGAQQLNELHQTKKFKYMPDPIPYIDDSKVRDIRLELGIPKSNKVFLHFGGLDYRKGTLDILKAIKLLSNEELNKMSFVFAGNIYSSMHDDFYREYELLKDRAQILVYDEFCCYEFLNNLCYSCDCILIPYKNVNQSSGVIGYSAYFRKPVIGPCEGLLGRLIDDYSLGVALPILDATSLAHAINGFIPPINSKYAESHSVQMFVNLFN